MFGTNAITKNHLVGAAVGVGVAAVAFYLYKKNQAKVDEFLRKQGINIKTSSCSNLEGLDIEGLTTMTEHIVDLIAEESDTESAEEIIVEAE